MTLGIVIAALMLSLGLLAAPGFAAQGRPGPSGIHRASDEGRRHDGHR